MIRHIISVTLENESGALSRVVGLFSQRGYNIESLTVAPTEDPSLSRMTIQIISDKKTLEQIKKQLNKLIDVIHIDEIQNKKHIEKEIILVKIKIIDKLEKIKDIIKTFKGTIIDNILDIYIIQVTGDSKTIDSFLDKLSTLSKVNEVVRSGIITMSKILSENIK